MASSSSVLREPTMDEILTSIREIIEENTAQAVRISDNMNHVSSDEKAIGEKPQLNNMLSVDDAMQALAARIGLVNEEKTGSATIETKPEDKFQRGVEELANNSDVEINTAASHRIEQSMDCKEGTSTKSKPLSADLIAQNIVDGAQAVVEQTLRPVLSKWIERQLPVIVEKILKEELKKAIENLQ